MRGQNSCAAPQKDALVSAGTSTSEGASPSENRKTLTRVNAAVDLAGDAVGVFDRDFDLGVGRLAVQLTD